MSDLTLPDALAERIRTLAQSEKMSIEELLTIMLDRYTVASRLKVAHKPLTLSGTTEAGTDEEETADSSPAYPVFGEYPPASLKAITADNIDQVTVLGALKFPHRVSGIGYSPDGRYLAVRLETKMVLWDMHTSQEYAVLEHDAWIEAFVFTPDGKSLIVSSGNVFGKRAVGSTLHYWNVATRQQEYTWSPQVGFAISLAANPKNPQVIALLSSERRFVEERPNAITTSNVGIELWEGKTHITRYTDFRKFYREGYNKLNDRVLQFGHDGKTVYVSLDNGGNFRGQVLAWEGLGNGELYAISEPDECFMGLRLDRYGNHLAISDAPNGKLSVRNLPSGAVIYASEETYQLPYWLAFDGSGSILMVGRNPKGRENGRIDFINLQTGETVKKLASQHVMDVTFSTDNFSFAALTNEILIWGIPQT
jgi:WD40 repeat protein